MGALAWWRRDRGVDTQRWLVVDVEASGLDAGRDRLLAVAAVGLRIDRSARSARIVPADSFEAVLRQEVPSERANVLLHGIGMQRQREGTPAGQALGAFARFAGRSPLLAFHAAFDRALLERTARAAAVEARAHRWVDIEQLCGATHPDVAARSLDEWLGHFGIRCAARHRAAADALAEAELVLRIWPRVAAEAADWAGVEALAARRRWLPHARRKGAAPPARL